MCDNNKWISFFQTSISAGWADIAHAVQTGSFAGNQWQEMFMTSFHPSMTPFTHQIYDRKVGILTFDLLVVAWWHLEVPSGSTLVQVLACCLDDTKPLPEPMLIYYQWGSMTLSINHLHRKFSNLYLLNFSWEIWSMYLQFMLFLHTDMGQVFEIVPHVRQNLPTQSLHTKSISTTVIFITMVFLTRIIWSLHVMG